MVDKVLKSLRFFDSCFFFFFLVGLVKQGLQYIYLMNEKNLKGETCSHSGNGI